MSPVCYTEYDLYRLANVTGTLLMGTYSNVFTTAFTTGMAIYPAWHISWEASDVSTLDPKPPMLTNDMRIPIWTGGVVSDGAWDNNGRGRDTSHGPLLGTGVLLFLVIGLPLLACVAGGFGCFCCHKKRKQRKANKLALVSSQVSRTDDQTPLELTTKPIRTP